MISDFDLMQTANKGLLLGLPITAREMGTLGRTAVTLGKAMNVGPTQALQDLITGLGRGSAAILDNLGITIKAEEAQKRYAESIGKSAKDLTEGEKKLAVYRAALEAAEQSTSKIGRIQETTGDAAAKLSAQWTNLRDAVAEIITKNQGAVEGFGALATVVGDVADSIRRNKPAFDLYIALLGKVTGLSGIGQGLDLASTLLARGPGVQTPIFSPEDIVPPSLDSAFAEIEKEAARLFEENEKRRKKAEEQAKQEAKRLQAVIDQLSGKGAQEELDRLTTAFHELGVSGIADLDALRRKLEEIEKQGAKIADKGLLGVLRGGKIEIPKLDIGGLASGLGDDIKSQLTEPFVGAALEAQQRFNDIAKAGIAAGVPMKDLASALESAGANGDQVKLAMESVSAGSVTTSGALDSLAQQLQVLASTTGGVAGKILNVAASLSAGAGGILSGISGFKSAKGGFGGLLQQLSSGAGIVGSAIGLVGGVVNGIKGLFGRGKQREQVTQGRDQFIQSMGGLEELQRRAAAAGVSLERLMKAKDSVKGFESAMKEVTTAIEKHERKIAGLTAARDASESLLDRIGKGGLSEGLSTALQELIGRVQGALAQAGLGLLKTGPLRDSQAFAEQEGIAADLAALIAGMREAGIVDAGSLAAGGAAAKELQTAAAAAATEAGLPATEATKAGFAAIAPVLREQLNAAIQSGRELDANTKALLEEAKANGIEIMADPLVESLAVQRDQLGVLRSIAGKEFVGGPSGAIPAARGLGPMITPNVGRGLGPLIQTHPNELAMVIPRSRMGPGGLISAASGLYARHELRGGRGRGETTINLNISEDPFASSVGRERLRRHTLKAVRRETSKHLAALVASGRA